MQIYIYFGLILVLLIILLYFLYKNYFTKKIPEIFIKNYNYILENLDEFSDELFYRELELFIKKVISIKFKKPEIYFLKPNLITKVYNWKIVTLLKEVDEYSKNIDLKSNKKLKKKLLKDLKNIL